MIQNRGYLVELKYSPTRKGKSAKEVGGEFRMSPKFGPYFLWPQDLSI